LNAPDPNAPSSGRASSGTGPALEIGPALVARNTVLNLIGLGLPMAVGVLALPLTIRGLGTERFGILSLVWVVVGYLTFFDFGLSRATTKFIAEALGKGDPEEVPGFLWTTVVVQGVLGIVGTALIVAATPLLVGRVLHVPAGLGPEARVSFILIGVSLPVVLVSASFRGALEAGQRFDLVNVVKGASSTLNYVLPLAGIGLGFDLRGIVALLLGARVLALVIWLWLCLKALPVLRRRPGFRRDKAAGLLRFGGWLTVSNIVRPVLTYLDRFLIGSLMDMKAVGFYVAPSEIVTKAGILPGSLILTLFPSFSAFQGREDHGRSRSLYAYAVKYMIIGVGPAAVLLVVLAGPVLRVWLGPEFALSSTLVFQVLAVGFLTTSLSDIPLALIQGGGRPDLPAKLNLAEVFIFVPLAWVAIKSWGIEGAAAAWTLRVTFEMAALFVMAAKIGNMRYTRRELFGTGIPQAVLALVLYAAGAGLVQHYWGKLYGHVIPLALYLTACGLFVLSAREIAWLRSGLLRLLPRHGREREGA
jgi:O-antigen/teichoic acid export membrane protein